MAEQLPQLYDSLKKLHKAVGAQRSSRYCLSLWSQFIRRRDGEKCVVCGSKEHLSAHHIFRKSFLKETRFQTGNGITLCRGCHKQPHEIFNGRADLDLPMDAEGGENIELSMEYLARLIGDARSRQILRDELYFFSDHALSTFKAAQSIDPFLPFPGPRIEQAVQIWRQTPRKTMEALLRAHGIEIPPDFIQPSSGITFFSS